MSFLTSIPLLVDVSDDWTQVRRFLVRAIAFCAILLALDHALGAILQAGLYRYFGFDRKTDILCVGHSQTLLGINEQQLGKSLEVTATQFTMDGVNVIDRHAMIRHFLASHPEVRLVLYDVESTLFTSDKLSRNSYRLFFPFMDDPAIAARITLECTDPADVWIRNTLWTSRFNEATINRSIRGWLNIRQNMKWGSLDTNRIKEWIRLDKLQAPTVNPAVRTAFLDTIDYLTSRNIEVMLWNAPIVDMVDDIDHAKRQAIRADFEKLAATNRRVTYLNYVDQYKTRYDLFYDHMHMNAKGQSELTAQLARDITRLGLLK